MLFLILNTSLLLGYGMLAIVKLSLMPKGVFDIHT